ncbi:splicing regulatory glutamine/lysine-rich protein 1-like [Macrobrachium rosenbergii]|uniref:splicing regulatory glutamine/lysine-rich protein 1-like n=1 Tax=Macrobrachium rosenbergii TaxID=79674 RepID=UPI0034D54DD4
MKLTGAFVLLACVLAVLHLASAKERNDDRENNPCVKAKGICVKSEKCLDALDIECSNGRVCCIEKKKKRSGGQKPANVSGQKRDKKTKKPGKNNKDKDEKHEVGKKKGIEKKASKKDDSGKRKTNPKNGRDPKGKREKERGLKKGPKQGQGRNNGGRKKNGPKKKKTGTRKDKTNKKNDKNPGETLQGMASPRRRRRRRRRRTKTNARTKKNPSASKRMGSAERGANLRNWCYRKDAKEKNACAAIKKDGVIDSAGRFYKYLHLRRSNIEGMALFKRELKKTLCLTPFNTFTVRNYIYVGEKLFNKKSGRE